MLKQTYKHKPLLSEPVNAIVSIIIGVLVLGLGIALIGYNENKAACHTHVRVAGYSKVEAVPCDANPNDFLNKAVFVSCPITTLQKFRGDVSFPQTKSTLGDAFEAKGTCFRRVVKALQCNEILQVRRVRNTNGERRTITIFSYAISWTSEVAQQTCTLPECDADRKKACGDAQNPSSFPVEPIDEAKYSKIITVGGFLLTKANAKKIPCDAMVQPKISKWTNVQESDDQPPSHLNYTNTKVKNLIAHTCWDKDQIGCMSVEYKTSNANFLTIVARWTSAGFVPYEVKRIYTCAGWTWHEFYIGRLNPHQVRERLNPENLGLLWGLRVLSSAMIVAKEC
eukprot:Platyproteum_vivax@DN6219_c0_g1_i2.p1